MSIYTFIPIDAETNPDPLDACEWDIVNHPHYHDCENCKHIQDGLCSFGMVYWDIMNLPKIQKEIEEMIKALDHSSDPPATDT